MGFRGDVVEGSGEGLQRRIEGRDRHGQIA